MSMVLTSRNNPLIKTFRLVRDQKRHGPSGLVLAEGVRVIREALRSGCRLEAVIAAERFGADPDEESLLSLLLARGITPVQASEALLLSLSAVNSPQGVLALVHMPAPDLQQVSLPKNPLVLCACGLQDPGNLGTLVRTAWAAGASLFLTTNDTSSARNPKSIRASAGACFHLPIIEHLIPLQVRDYCRRHRIQLFRTTPHEGRIYSEADFRAATAILLGNEARGISKSDWGNISPITIPMARSAESLNVASAGAVLLFEVLAQRSQLRRSGSGIGV